MSEKDTKNTEQLKITSITILDASRVLSSVYRRNITEDQVRQIVQVGNLLRSDGRFSLIDYIAFLAGEEINGC